MNCKNCGKPVRITYHGTVTHAARGEWIHCDTPLSTVAEVKDGGAVIVWKEEPKPSPFRAGWWHAKL